MSAQTTHPSRPRRRWRVVVLIAVAAGMGAPAGMAGAATRTWRLATTGGNGSRVYVDTATLTRAADNPAVVTFSQKTTNMKEKFGKRTIASNLYLLSIDCANNVRLYGPGKDFDSKGATLRSYPSWETEWDPIVPNSIGANVRDFVCAKWDAAATG